MNREEALHTLGLDADATAEDIKAAYKESAQILHPDRFAGNRKLQARATEQFKNLQEAYEYLKNNPHGSQGQSRGRASYTREDQLNARLAGIDAARVQLVAQRDSYLDQRRTGLILLGVGVLVAILLRRIRPIAALAGAAVIWGVIDLIAASRNLSAINEQLAQLKKEKNAILDQLAGDDETEEAPSYDDASYEDEDDYDDEAYDPDVEEDEEAYEYVDEEDEYEYDEYEEDDKEEA